MPRKPDQTNDGFIEIPPFLSELPDNISNKPPEIEVTEDYDPYEPKDTGRDWSDFDQKRIEEIYNEKAASLFNRLAVSRESALEKAHNEEQMAILKKYFDKQSEEELQLLWKLAEEEYRARSEAGKDVKTGLLNRQSLERFYDFLLEERKQNEYLCAILLDLDNLKDLNEILGHDKADELIKKLAEALQESIRTFDAAARTGGDEFTIVLSKIKKQEDVLTVIERILNLIHGIKFNYQGEERNLTCSAGFSMVPLKELPEEHPYLTTVTERADKLAAFAKVSGKDRITGIVDGKAITYNINIQDNKLTVVDSSDVSEIEKNSPEKCTKETRNNLGRVQDEIKRHFGPAIEQKLQTYNVDDLDDLTVRQISNLLFEVREAKNFLT